jgi:hypothetical protein
MNPPATAVMRTLELASKTLGGVAPLAAKLNATVADVERWIAGIPPPPHVDIYSRALDIVSAG